MYLKEHDASLPLPIGPAPVEVIDAAVAPLSLARLFDGPYGPPFGFGTSVDPVTLADTGLAAIASDRARLRITLGISVAAATVSYVADPVADAALQALARREMLSGLTLGTVLTADGRSPTWIKQHGFVKMWPVRQHPRHGRQLQGIYNTSLMAGIAHGRHFSPVAVRNLFAFLLAQMSAPARQMHGTDQETWKPRQWEAYYRACASLLQHEIDRH